MNRLVCAFCGEKRKVFLDIDFNEKENTYKMTPICLQCKRKNLELKELIDWERKLKSLEKQISSQLIMDYFPKIKFKKSAEKKLINLMKKYSVRKVFEVCSLSNNNFNLHALETKCKQ